MRFTAVIPKQTHPLTIELLSVGFGASRCVGGVCGRRQVALLEPRLRVRRVVALPARRVPLGARVSLSHRVPRMTFTPGMAVGGVAVSGEPVPAPREVALPLRVTVAQDGTRRLEGVARPSARLCRARVPLLKSRTIR